MSEINSLLYNSAFMELLWRGQSFKLNHSIWLQKKETALRRRNTGSFFCMENMIAKQFETIQDIFKKQVIQHYSIILQPTNQIYWTIWEVGILPARKKNITEQSVLTGTLIPFCEAILGYFGIIDILFSHPVSKLGELKVWRNFWSSDDIQSHRRRSDLYSIGRVVVYGSPVMAERYF